MSKVIYSTYKHSTKPSVRLKQGFSWPAFVFGPLWALYHRLPWPFVGVLAVYMVAWGGWNSRGIHLCVTSLGAVGFYGHLWVGEALTSRGYRYSGEEDE